MQGLLDHAVSPEERVKIEAILDTPVDAAVFGSVRATVTAGESLPADLQRRFSERFAHPVLDGIGSTEALHIFISNTLTAQSPGSSGWVVPGYEAKLLADDDREVTEPDTPGYLHVRGPSTAASSPATRRRCSRSGGSRRVASTSRSAGWWRSSSHWMSARTGPVPTTWKSSRLK